MKQGQAATTAKTVAFARAIETIRPSEERLFEDPYAVRFLEADDLWFLERLRKAGMRRFLLWSIDAIGPGLLPYAIARTAYIDEALAGALRRGVAQVLILGAGYDTRALRMPGIENAVVLEVDHPDTQAVKRECLGADVEAVRDRLRFVGVDFDREDLGERLRSSGFRFDQETFVIWEGVTQYLTAPAVDATFALLAGTAPGSEIAFTYLDRALLDGTRSFPGGRRLLLAVRLVGEPFLFGLEPKETAAYLRERGLNLLADIGGSDFTDRYFAPRGRADRATETERVALARPLAQP